MKRQLLKIRSSFQRLGIVIKLNKNTSQDFYPISPKVTRLFLIFLYQRGNIFYPWEESQMSPLKTLKALRNCCWSFLTFSLPFSLRAPWRLCEIAPKRCYSAFPETRNCTAAATWSHWWRQFFCPMKSVCRDETPTTCANIFLHDGGLNSRNATALLTSCTSVAEGNYHLLS